MLNSRTRYGRLLGSGFLILLLATLVACSSNSQSVTPTPTSTAPVTLNLGIPQEALNSPVVGQLSATTPLKVMVNFKLNQSYLNTQDGQKAQQQGTDLSTVANQIGITDQQYQQIKRFFGVQKAVLTLNSLHTSLEIDAPASTFMSLLHTQFVNHKYQNRTFYAPSTPIQVPAVVAGVITSVTGLDSYTRPPVSGASLRSASGATPLSTKAASSPCFQTGYRDDQPQAVIDAYGLNQFASHNWRGQNTTIFLVEFAPFSLSDVQPYLNCVGYRGKLSTITVQDDPPTPDQDADVEPTLDIDMIASIAPYANIVVYQIANDQGFEPVLARIINDNHTTGSFKALSISWGESELYETIGDMNAVSQQLQVLTQVEHISVFAASGDCGAYESRQYPDTLSVNFPSSAPYAISVGGTLLTTNAKGARTSETVWSMSQKADPNQCDNDWGSGGGLSAYFKLPSWQNANGVRNKYSNGMREVPDIAAVADWLPIYYQGEWFDSGGTSAATPIWAAAYMILDQALAQNTHYYVYGLSPFYAAAQHSGNKHPFYSVVQGSNRYYTAASGWNYCTGLGTPNMVDLYNTLVPLL